MLVFRCACGDETIYTSVGVPPCSKCTNCGSTFAPLGVDVREAPEPHQFVTRYNEFTGKPYELCTRCGESCS